MTDARKSSPPTKYKKWAAPEEFLDSMTRRAEHESDWTSNQILFVHYQKWAHKNGLSALEVLTFGKRLHAACSKRVDAAVGIPVHGHLLYPVVIVDPPKIPEEEDAERVPHQPVVRGQVRMKRSIQYREQTLEAGAVVEWMAPTPMEQQNIERLANRDDSMNWLVVVFNGRRRFVPGNAVEKV